MYIYRGQLQFGQWANNEGITVIFPSEFRLGDPVYTCWQWTVSPAGGENNVSVFRTGTIDNVRNVSPTCQKFGFYYDDDYSFDATFSGGVGIDIAKLSVTIRASDGKISDRADLQLVYKPNSDVSPDPTVPRIYLGKLNYNDDAIDETIIIVAPGSMDEGNAICAFWTWTKKVNADNVTTISKVKAVWKIDKSFLGETFQFQSPHKYYTLDAAVDEPTRKLMLTVTGSQSKSKELVLALQDLDARSAGKRREIISHTTEIFNDTNEVVVCSLKASGTSLTDEVLGTASLIPGGAGLLTTLPAAGLFSAVGGYVASVGWHVAVGGTAKVFNSSAEDGSAVIFPLDAMKRTSGSIAIPTNDLHINLVRVDNSNRRLVVSAATVKELGTLTQKLSKIMPGGESAPLYKELLTINLPSDMRLLAYRNVVVPGLSAELPNKVKSIEDMEESDIPNALVTFDKSTSTPNWYGTPDEYFKGAQELVYPLFSYSPDVDLAFSQGVSGSGESHATVITVERDDGPRELTLLKFTNCIMDNEPMRRLLNFCQTEEDVKNTIKENASYWGYEWGGPNEPLVGYKPGDVEYTLIFYSKNPDRCVYFIAQCNPMQSLVKM